MAPQPAVVIVARHGPRLDAADQQWHLSTPTPYDPPLTYGGWNQSRALGQRVASLLHAREEQINDNIRTQGALDANQAQDFAADPGQRTAAHGSGDGLEKRRRRKHKIIIHTSPFLRCIQTSVAIAAGIAQFHPPVRTTGARSSPSRQPGQLHSASASPKMRATGDAPLPSINEPVVDFAHAIAKRSLRAQNKRYQKAKLRVDAFLGEWLNPSYFDHITPPPPSNMMLATAKAELMSNESIHVYTPAISSPKSQASSSLWGGGKSQNPSRESTVDDWTLMKEQMSDVSGNSGQPGRRSRHNSLESNDSNGGRVTSGRRSPFKPASALRPFTEVFHGSSEAEREEEMEAIHTPYVPPQPTYAVSSADTIPQGYFAHARDACTSVDYQWDSSKPTQDWGDGGMYGEEWSSLHRRLRRGLNHLVNWYSQHDSEARGEDSLGFDQAERHEDEDEEDLVVILVTHGAPCNALIGALTGQPVLLDVGMASLTMAARKDDAPETYILPTERDTSPYRRRGSIDSGLSSIYEMKFVSSSEHLRPGANPNRVPAVHTVTQQAGLTRAGPHPIPGYQLFAPHGAPGGDRRQTATADGNDMSRNADESGRARSSALGSIRRPSAPSLMTNGIDRSNSAPFPAAAGGITPPLTPGLWTPQGGRSPNLAATANQVKHDRRAIFGALNDGGNPTNGPATHGLTSSPDPYRPSTESHLRHMQPLDLGDAADINSATYSLGTGDNENTGVATELERRKMSDGVPVVPEVVPTALARGLSQKGLWGSKPKGDKVQRMLGEGKRRWTVSQSD